MDSFYVAPPVAKDGPNVDCEDCDGEGADLDPYGMFDYKQRGPCPSCWKDATTDAQKG